MKTCKKLAALVAALTLAMVPLAGCGGGGTESSGTTGSAAGTDKEALIKSEPSSISFLALDYDESKTDSAYNLAIAKFKEVYGKDVKIIQAGADQKVMDKVAANIAAKDPIDVFVMITEQYLNMIHQNYLLPVDDYVTVPAEGNDRTVMDSFLKFDGKYYGYGGGINPYVLYYNKDLLVANGYSEDYPKEQYEAGNWTWDTFRELARACTDADSGIMGLENMYDEVFQASNGTSAVSVGEDAKYSLNIKSPAMRESLEFVMDIFKTNPICGNGYLTGQAKFLTGKAVMHGAFNYEEKVFNGYKADGTIKFDFGVTAFPAGPSNTDKKNYAHTSAYGISVGSKAPYSAGAFIEILAKIRNEQDETNKASLMEGSDELYASLAKNILIPAYTDGVLENGIGAFYLMYSARQGEDISTSLDSYQTTYQKMIEDANKRIG